MSRFISRRLKKFKNGRVHKDHTRFHTEGMEQGDESFGRQLRSAESDRCIHALVRPRLFVQRVEVPLGHESLDDFVECFRILNEAPGKSWGRWSSTACSGQA